MNYSVQFSYSVNKQLLNLHCMLLGGQSFRWKEITAGTFIGVVRNNIVEVEQRHDKCLFKLQSKFKLETESCKSLLEDYLQLKFPIEKFYQSWSERDPTHFEKKASQLPGVRMLRQDPFENILSFICSQNNNISRISQLVGKLCTNFGQFIGRTNEEDFFTFPSLAELTKIENLESRLRELSFGYRAKYISKAVQFFAEQNTLETDWLMGLRELPYKEAKDNLMRIPGIGPKVADCVCLMSLDKTNAVPVDTHVLQIALRDYQVSGLKKKQNSSSLSATDYNTITQFFQQLFGEHAGWAHTVLFCSDLRKVPGKRPLEELNGCKVETIEDVKPSKAIRI